MWAIFERTGECISGTYATKEEAEHVKHASLLYISSDVVKEVH